MLKQAAADQWSVDASQLKATEGYIINSSTNEKLSYGALAEAAKEIDLKELPELKAREDWKLIGTKAKRLDIPEKVTGQAEFGIDVRLENMKYAVMVHPTTIGGKITKILNAEEVESQRGIEKVLKTEYGVAIIADNTWSCLLYTSPSPRDGLLSRMPSSA